MKSHAELVSREPRMKSAAKGVLLSGLVYPGLGQLVQKHYFRAVALVGIVTVSLAATLYSVAHKVQETLTALAAADGAADVPMLLREAARVSAGGESNVIEVASLLIAGCWIVGIVDAYLSGKRIDRDDTA